MSHDHHHTTHPTAGAGFGRAARPPPGCRASVSRPWSSWARRRGRSAAGPTVGVATSSNFGTVLADAQGFALYTLPSDHNGMSTCTGPCIPVWPALDRAGRHHPDRRAGGDRARWPPCSSPTARIRSPTTGHRSTPSWATPPPARLGEQRGRVPRREGRPPRRRRRRLRPRRRRRRPPASSATTTPASAPTPTSSPASGGSPSGSGTPTPAPVGATASSTGGNAVAPATSPAPSAAPTALAVTGPGPGLLWIMAIGAGLVTISLSTLAVFGDRGRLRRTARSASRAARWLVGR